MIYLKFLKLLYKTFYQKEKSNPNNQKPLKTNITNKIKIKIKKYNNLIYKIILIIIIIIKNIQNTFYKDI